MNYTIISADSDYDLIRGVKQAMEQGWRPTGGVSVYATQGVNYMNSDGDNMLNVVEACFFQAMTKVEENL